MPSPRIQGYGCSSAPLEARRMEERRAISLSSWLPPESLWRHWPHLLSELFLTGKRRAGNGPRASARGFLV
jgi:hypothetical protein